MEHLQRALALDPFLPAALYNLGNARQLEGRLDDAIACYNQALWYEPDHADANANLGAALHQKHRTSEAAEHYQRSLELDPASAEAQNNLGALFHERQELELAIECYRRAVELDANYVDAHVNLGDALRDAGQTAAAVESYQRGLLIRPRDARFVTNSGVLCNSWEQFAAGGGVLSNPFVDALPTSAEAWNSLGVVLSSKVRQCGCLLRTRFASCSG